MTNAKKEVLATPLIPPLALNVPEDRSAANAMWKQVFWEAHGYEQMLGFNLSMHLNPEYFLEHWSNTILDSQWLRQDVWGWALRALQKEQRACEIAALNPKILELKNEGLNDEARKLQDEMKGYADGNRPHRGDMLEESRSLHFLSRFQEWADARLAYHRAALKLTFYKDDKISGKEPVASNVDRLRARFADWRDVRVQEQWQLLENDLEFKAKGEIEFISKNGVRVQGADKGERGALFRSWLANKGLKTGVIADGSIDWLCWVHLIEPIGRHWNLHEIAFAILKMFDIDYREAAKEWWAHPPKNPKYEPVEVTDGFVECFMKQGLPQEYHEWRADRLARRLDEVAPFADKLRKQLKTVGFDYHGRRGSPKAEKGEAIPPEWDNPSPEIFIEILRRKELDNPHATFAPTAAKEDADIDKPEGYLLAKKITF